MYRVREVEDRDLPFLKEVIDSSGLFPSEMLDDMIAPYLKHESPGDIWLTLEQDTPLAIAYCAPERLTEGTYNLYLIAVLKSQQGVGIGRQLLKELEDHLRQTKVRVLLVETSGNPEFELTRKFYIQNGYTLEASIRDFYKEGEDNMVFWKKLNT